MADIDVRVRRVAEIEEVKRTMAGNEYYKKAQEAQAEFPEVTHDDLRWADGICWGSPTRYGNMAAQVKLFIDSTAQLWLKGELEHKAAGVFTSTGTIHGGQETTLIALYITLMHFGGIIVPPGYTDPVKFGDGNPYGVSHITGPENKNEVSEATTAALDHLARRVVTLATRLAG